ncbi:MAG: hypothetical protein HWE27_01925 [Gammaproteobacteria bacterium]|nr:hypothetical protein [Gammaproteobacteria bacterium]
MLEKPNHASQKRLLNHISSRIGKIRAKTVFTKLVALLLLTACENGPEPVETWQHATTGSYEASLSEDGNFAIVSTVNHQAGYWDLSSNKLLFQWRHSDNPDSGIIASDISPDGSRAITADKQTFVIWNTTSGKPYGFWQTPDDISAVALSDKGRYVLLGLRSGKAIHIDMETGRRLEFTGHRIEPIASVDMSANGEWAFTGASDGRAILWNTQTGQPRFIFEHESRVTLVKLEADGRLAFSSGTRGNAFIWNLESGTERVRLALKPREYVISAAAFSKDGTQIATGAPGRDIVLWSTQSGGKLNQWKAATRDQWKPSGAIVWAIAFHEDGRHLITEASSGFGQKWLLQLTD